MRTSVACLLVSVGVWAVAHITGSDAQTQQSYVCPPGLDCLYQQVATGFGNQTFECSRFPGMWAHVLVCCVAVLCFCVPYPDFCVVCAQVTCATVRI
jgi:hypothetical protein